MRLEDFRDAFRRIENLTERTPLVEVPGHLLPVEDMRLFLKLECRQKSGSFKARGASNFIERLRESSTPQGVVTYSSGNHGRAMADAARRCGIPAVVTVPIHIDASKRAAIVAAGAEVIEAGPTSETRFRRAAEIVEERGYYMVPPFDHEWIIAGQGTVALEILEQIDDPLAGVWVPVGGGGLSAGMAGALRAAGFDGSVFTVEPEGSAALTRSLERGARTKLDSTDSIADGLLPLAVGERNYALLARSDVTPVTVPEDMIRAVFATIRALGVETEPSGAVSATPLLGDGHSILDRVSPGTHVAVVSGGNISEQRLRRLLGAG